MANLTTDNIKKILKDNNEFIFKRVKTDTGNIIKSAIEENNKFIFKKIDQSFKENNKVLVKRIDEVVNARLTEFSDSILETIDINRNEANEKFEVLNKKIDVISNDLTDVKQDIKFIRHDISDIGADMSNKPSRKQFEEFKSTFKNYPTV